MSHLYFIGGAPRSGKSTVIQQLISHKPMLAASTDAIRSVAKGIQTPADNPRLFKTQRGAFGSEKHLEILHTKPMEALAYEVAEAEETWQSVLDFISYYQQDNKDVAIEGVAVLPKQLARLNLRYKAVFFVNLSNQTDEILYHAKKYSSDWLHKYDEQTIKTYCAFNQLLNEHYAEEAKKYDFPVVEVDTHNFMASIDFAVDKLLA